MKEKMITRSFERTKTRIYPVKISASTIEVCKDPVEIIVDGNFTNPEILMSEIKKVIPAGESAIFADEKPSIMVIAETRRIPVSVFLEHSESVKSEVRYDSDLDNEA